MTMTKVNMASFALIPGDIVSIDDSTHQALSLSGSERFGAIAETNPCIDTLVRRDVSMVVCGMKGHRPDHYEVLVVSSRGIIAWYRARVWVKHNR